MLVSHRCASSASQNVTPGRPPGSRARGRRSARLCPAWGGAAASVSVTEASALQSKEGVADRTESEWPPLPGQPEPLPSAVRCRRHADGPVSVTRPSHSHSVLCRSDPLPTVTCLRSGHHRVRVRDWGPVQSVSLTEREPPATAGWTPDSFAWVGPRFLEARRGLAAPALSALFPWRRLKVVFSDCKVLLFPDLYSLWTQPDSPHLQAS